MSAEPLLRLFDNPIRVAQARRRLRRKQAVPTFVVLALIAFSVVLFAASTDSSREVWRATRDFFLIAIAVVLCLRGTAQVSSTLAEDRSSGLLDFHRATPTSAWTDAFGYAAGCTAREYLGALLLSPFFLFASLRAGDSFGRALLALYLVLASAFLCHAFGMFVGLSARGRRAGPSAVAALVTLTFLALPLASVEFVALGHSTPLPALLSLGYLDMAHTPGSALTFFGIRCSHVTFTLIFQGYLLVFLTWATARRLCAESAHALSRGGGLAFFALTALFLIGPAWEALGNARVLAAAIALFLIGGAVLASVLAVSLVPSFLESLRSIRRARRFQRRPHWFEVGASTWPLVIAFSLLTAAGVALLLRRGALAGLPLSSSVGALDPLLALTGWLAFLAFEVGAYEYFQLQWQRASRSGVFLVAFLSLVLPWILGAATSPLFGDSQVPLYLFATSPLYALGTTARALALRIAEEPAALSYGRIYWSLTVTCAGAAAFWVAALRARARIEAREIDSGDLPSIDAYRPAV